MKCQKFEGFKNAYVNKTLKENQKKIFEKHLGLCRKCREDISYIENIKPYMEIQFKAPQNFTNTVMKAVYKIKEENTSAADMEIRISRLCKNLGISLVLASTVMILNFFMPWGNLYQSFLLTDSRNGSNMNQTSKIKDSLSGMNDNINDIFESIQKSVTKFKEGV